MSAKPRDPTLEQVNRLTQAVADLTESHAAQGASIISILEHMRGHLETFELPIGALTKEVRGLAAEQVLLGNRVEHAFSRALRTNIRLEEIEDIQRQP
jgi:hypothetical protein